MTKFKITGLLLTALLSVFSINANADAIGTGKASCLVYGPALTARVLTWHSPLLHRDPSSYSSISVRMKVQGIGLLDSGWFDWPTFTERPLWLAWNYYTNGKAPNRITGLHRANLRHIELEIGTSPTYARCSFIY